MWQALARRSASSNTNDTGAKSGKRLSRMVSCDSSGTMRCTTAAIARSSSSPHHVEIGSPVVPLVSW